MTSVPDLQAVEHLGDRELRSAFGSFPTGVTALCALGENGPDGMVASAFTAASLAPPLVTVCVQRTSATWPRLRRQPHLGVSILAAGQEAACRSLSARTGERFAGVAWEAAGSGAVFVTGAVSWLDCVVHDELPAGDHVIVVLRIRRLLATRDRLPLVFHASRFRALAG
ncbi:flavin reductase family protein [Amycolatopsis australiensis]|uniref:NADH-FMN oxidoreductase RutF, flavin reductase (DIM6/NTAB) family n=1 Tax=Amycolatopsis australiensis TaxID=546364 RepID=A0A1K1SQL2_9PSEU|nr:flavin reductase family protein [Amycolatopsis australiensis]SFW86688.1 NADH-FMN oxidoreductase RutF, flavin reductase (DIM6/NTAB) family [Amycolatopsis australiensis]